MSQSTLCPRCQVNEAGLGTSRVNAGENICSMCEQAESMEDFFNGKVTPQNEWPVKVEVIE